MARPRKKLDYTEISSLLYDVHVNNINVVSREIFVHNPHDSGDSEECIDYRSATTFIKNLQVLEYLSKAKITIHMHSPGGSWHDGMAMFDAIQNCKSQVTMVAYAQAASMSGVLLQAADYRVMTRNTHFMLHYGTIGFEATSTAASEIVKFNDRECRKMLDIFVNKAVHGPYFQGKQWTRKKIADFIDKEMKSKGDWYMDAEEAINFGFADAILGEVMI